MKVIEMVAINTWSLRMRNEPIDEVMGNSEQLARVSPSETQEDTLSVALIGRCQVTLLLPIIPLLQWE
uniref:Uncharacterized protein n=1 Tax=Anguilla anguilla TaxID=7936 RepID=A0A0E9RD82_ANGAN